MKLVFLGFLALLLGLGWWLYTPDRTAAWLAARYVTADDRFVEVLGVRLRVRMTGPETAPVLILLHGFGASLETWELWAEASSGRYRVVRFDLPGFGLTGADPTGDYSDARAVDVLAGLMDALGVEQADLAGNSLGGKIAWNFAAAYPARVRKLVLISPDGFASPGFAYGVRPKLPIVIYALPYMLPRFLLRMNLAVAYADPAKLTEPVLARYWDMMRGPGDRRAMLARMGQVMLVPPGPVLAKIKAPTLIVWGEKDGMIPFSNSADYVRDMADARLVALPGLGHVPFEEDPAGSLAPVEAFLGS